MFPQVHVAQGSSIPGRCLMSQHDYGFGRSGVCGRGHCIHGAVSITVRWNCLPGHSNGDPGSLQGSLVLTHPALMWLGCKWPSQSKLDDVQWRKGGLVKPPLLVS